MKKKNNVISVIVYTFCAALLLVGVFLVMRQYVIFPWDYVEPPAPTPTPAATQSQTPAPSITPNNSVQPTPTLTPAPTVYVKKAPIRIYFPEHRVMSDILPVGIIQEGEDKGKMATIDDPDLSAWYEKGPSPGEPGNALINGHKSWKGKAGRFQVLWRLEPNDEVLIEYEDGTTATFYVRTVNFYERDAVPDSVMDLTSGDVRMTLITCYGEYDNLVSTSKQRCVVVCMPEPVPQIEVR